MSFDCIIIGAGMSGLAAGIRLAMFDKKVCILEKHSVPGGLNSYYQRGGRKLDVGLHAMTNYVDKREKGTPLNKILKQLRIGYDDLQLSPQKYSEIRFAAPGEDFVLKFSNDKNLLEEEIKKKFPLEMKNFFKLTSAISDFDLSSSLKSLNFGPGFISSRRFLKDYLDDPLLVEMIMCPLLTYGSAWEDDMELRQFIIMFRSIFLEGLCRPREGIRSVIGLLIDKYRGNGGEIRFKTEVTRIKTQNGKVWGVELAGGEILEAKKVISTAGRVETEGILDRDRDLDREWGKVGRPGFVETILVTDQKPAHFDYHQTTVFYNEGRRFNYRRPKTLVDHNSALLCLSNNYRDDHLEEGIMRITHLANYSLWKELTPDEYRTRKEESLRQSLKIASKCFPKYLANSSILFQDTFTPLTVERYTGHFEGAVYGAPAKQWDGKTSVRNLFLAGTDQGFLGIVGSMLSGISMANGHCLSD